MPSSPKWKNQWDVHSETSDATYTVSEDSGGNFACSCKGWTMHTPRRDCKHIASVKMRSQYDRVVVEEKGREASRSYWEGIGRKAPSFG